MAETETIGDNKYQVSDGGSIFVTKPNSATELCLTPDGRVTNREWHSSIIIEAARLQAKWRREREDEQREQDECNERLRALTPVYSGDKSVAFWHIVNALPRSIRGEAYSCGVRLQTAECHELDEIRRLVIASRGKAEEKPSDDDPKCACHLTQTG